MCSPKVPRMETPVYGTAPEPTAAPVLAGKEKDARVSVISSKKRGTRALRTDLGIPGVSAGQRTGLQIPV